jgi:hypothetical protein
MDDVDRLAEIVGGGTVLVVDGVHALVRAAEAEIARRGLLAEYAKAIEGLQEPCQRGFYFMDGAAGSEHIDFGTVGAAITAPPDVRVRAMLQVLGVAVH